MKKSSAKFFGKSLLALALGVIAVAGLAVAGLLSYYGKVVGTATVHQSIRVYDVNNDQLAGECTGNNVENCKLTWSIGEVVAGSSGSKHYQLKNNLNKEVTVPGFEVSVNPANQGVTARVVDWDSEHNQCGTSEISGSVTVLAASGDTPGTYDFCVEYESDPATIPGNYEIDVLVKAS